MKLFGRGRKDRPEVRLRRAVERAGQPTTHRVAALLESLGHESATPEALAELDASLRSVGLTTYPSLSEVDGDSVVEVQRVEAGVPVAQAVLADEAPEQEEVDAEEDARPESEPTARQPANGLEDVTVETEPDEARQQPSETAEEVAPQLREQQDRHDAELSALRDELQTELAVIREQAAGEHRMREEAEARLAETKEELEAKTAALADAERRIDDVYEQRLSGILEAQESARKEREQAAQELHEARAERDRLEAETTDLARRREAERAEAQSKADEALALLEAVRAEGDQERERRAAIERRLNALIAGGKAEEREDRVEPPAVAPVRMPEPERPPRREPPLGEDPPAPAPEHQGGSNGDAAEQRAPVFHQPPPSKSSSRLSLPKLGRGRKREKAPSARYTCAVTGIEAPSDSEWELRRHGWIVSGDNALSPEAQADGWQYPEGAALPFRKLSER